ncbi:hypothetical protein [Actinobacillus pleuropneumoniae]|uniref:Lipoprotein n=1 Tax=Actinobacillus pleuropneumoniae serovar 6 str. Femo TaxID=754256 RepID=A0A828PQ34_ACTPL|nr:hypothetical protein [Actinobacillus pleuropneumoniae]EFM90857.1 hypothetical protein appser6_21890 [Actinobacillus pleuropneumoniae serovar 6 str. Femo]EFN03412.1 hypothetical protein appser13_4870 [Actinobacillus pleuropneumoniae serovar 13 str. N273]UKH13003.1 hypothetical protein D1099_02775 [Actinobacillus pleuropneumoniae serovar 6 str. Femo]UKH13051.1 hypothetical protein D1099_03085 [Actinobacillus pleuropneumoniae serovar 6 str. Femo]SUU61482.1 Uncharacterised protein [Actinobacill
MRKLLLILSVCFISACGDKLPVQAFGMPWDMSEAEISTLKSSDTRFKNLAVGRYEIVPPAPDIKDGHYLAQFDGAKLVSVSGYFLDVSKNESNRIFDFYDSKLTGNGLKKSELAILPQAHKVCIETGYCVIKSYQYAKDDLSATISVRRDDTLSDISDSVVVTYNRLDYFNKSRAKALSK